MAIGWIRAYEDEYRTLRARSRFILRQDRAEFRRDFRTDLLAEARQDGNSLRVLHWGDELTLPDGLSDEDFTPVSVDGQAGFVRSDHLVEIAWARKINEIFDQPENADKGAIQVDGKMVERLHADMGKRAIAIADAIAARS